MVNPYEQTVEIDLCALRDEAWGRALARTGPSAPAPVGFVYHDEPEPKVINVEVKLLPADPEEVAREFRAYADRVLDAHFGDGTANQRANALADECQRLRDENTQLLAENARLRRRR